MSLGQKRSVDLFVQQGGSVGLRRVEALVNDAGMVKRAFETGEQLKTQLSVEGPTVVVFDSLLPDSTAHQLVQQLVASYPSVVPVVVLKGSDARNAIRFCSLTITKVILEESDETEIWEVLTSARQAASEIYAFREESRLWQQKFESCTPDEKMVLKLWYEGLSNKQMTSKLDIAPRTLQLRKKAILDKLEVSNIFVLIRQATRLKLSYLFFGQET